jgi:hypothetical protein
MTTNTPCNPATERVPEQLALLADDASVAPLPLQFRLDHRTRERGLAHIAALRAQLAARAAARSEHPSERAA